MFSHLVIACFRWLLCRLQQGSVSKKRHFGCFFDKLICLFLPFCPLAAWNPLKSILVDCKDSNVMIKKCATCNFFPFSRNESHFQILLKVFCYKYKFPLSKFVLETATSLIIWIIESSAAEYTTKTAREHE